MKREDLNFILQKASLNELEELFNKIKKNVHIKTLQPPVQQTLLQPVYDPISEGEFYIGEILVTTTIVQIQIQNNTTYKGWAMVMDDNEKLSFYIAICDACYGADLFKKEIEELAFKILEKTEKTQKILNKKINSTRVNFDLM